MRFDQVIGTAAALMLLGGGVQGLRRGEIVRRRAWGEFGGPKEYPPLRGRTALAFSIWLLVAGVGILVWIWR